MVRFGCLLPYPVAVAVVGSLVAALAIGGPASGGRPWSDINASAVVPSPWIVTDPDPGLDLLCEPGGRVHTVRYGRRLFSYKLDR